MKQKRAGKGGQLGANGEFYEGGKFLPSTEAPKRAAKTSQATRRFLVEPGVIAEIPGGTIAIFPQIKHFVTFSEGKAVVRFENSHPAITAHFPSPERLHTLVRMFNGYARHYPEGAL